MHKLKSHKGNTILLLKNEPEDKEKWHTEDSKADISWSEQKLPRTFS